MIKLSPLLLCSIKIVTKYQVVIETILQIPSTKMIETRGGELVKEK